MGDIFERQANAVEAFVRGLPVVEHQVGAVFILNGEAKGVDLFDSPQTFRSLMPKILRGYALDAIDLRLSSPNPLPREASGLIKTRAEDFMRQVMYAPRTQFPSPGLGETWRLFAPQLAGGGLTLGGTLVHMSAFRA